MDSSSEAPTRTGRRRTAAWLVLAAALAGAVPLHLVSPPSGPDASRLYLERAQTILGERAPGISATRYPAHTAWVSFPLAAIQDLSWRLSGEPRRDTYLVETQATWATGLRGAWALLGACVIVAGASLAARLSRRERRVAAGCAAGLLVVAPILAQGVALLSPGVPAALLLLMLTRALLPDLSRRSAGFMAAAAAGAILAWFPAAFPAAVLGLIATRLRGTPWSVWAATVAGALFLGLALEPAHLLDPAGVPRRLVYEWIRQGGAAPEGFPGSPAVLALASFLGPGVWVLWPLAFRGRPLVAPSVMAIGAWVLQAGIPYLLGVDRAGAVQESVAPLMAAWGATAVGLMLPASWSRLRVAWIIAALFVVSVLPARFDWQKTLTRNAETATATMRDLKGILGGGGLWVSELPLFSDPEDRGEDSISVASRGFVLPRDSRFPGRYDYAYWPRWYAGFEWVVLSSARVRENLSRKDAVVPRHFYTAVEAQGNLLREWGDAESGAGYRIYRIPPESSWRQPLSAEELAALRGGPEMTWFLSRLGDLYVAAEDLGAAALIFRQGTSWDPAGVSLYNNLGAVYLRQGEYEMAAQAFEQGLEIQPESFELLFNYAQAAAEQGLHSRAERLLRRALTVRPRLPAVHYALGRVFLAQGKDRQARMALERYLELDPGTPRRDRVEEVLNTLRQRESDAASESSLSSEADSVPRLTVTEN